MFATQTIASSHRLPQNSFTTTTMTLIQELQDATTSCNWLLASQKAQKITAAGRIAILQSIQQNHTFNPLPMAENLLATLASSQLQWEDDVKYHLARATRLFLELSCMKAVSENRDIYRTTQETLRTQLDTLLDHARPEEVALKYELKCSSEALKLLEKTDFKTYLLAIFEAATDPSTGTLSSLFSLIPNLLSRKSQGWFSDVLFISWFTPAARTNLEIYQQIIDTLKPHLTTLEIAQSAVEFFADILWKGAPALQQKALQGTPGLFTLLNQERPPRKLFNLLPTMWPVRYRTIQIVSTLSTHPNTAFQTQATQALLQRRIQESNPLVKKLLTTLDKDPTFSAQWKDQFEAQKALFIDQNIKDKEEVKKEEARIKNLEEQLEQATASQRYSQEQLKELRQKIEEDKAYVEILRQETQAHRQNVDELHLQFKKGVNQILDDVFDHQPRQSMTLPPHFCCPITQDLMKDPVIAADGKSYERSAIEKWLMTNDTSPITRQKLESKTLFPNRDLKDAIDLFIKGEAVPTPSPRPTSNELTSSAASTSPSNPSRKGTYRKFMDTLFKPETEKKTPPLSHKGTEQPATKEAYANLLMTLHETKAIRSQTDLANALEKLFKELNIQQSPQLTPQQEKTYALVQKLYVNGKLSEIIATALIQMNPHSQNAVVTLDSASSASDPGMKDAYLALLMQLHETKEIRKQKELSDLLQNLFTTLNLSPTPHLTLRQEMTFALVQKLYVKGKMSELVSKTLLRINDLPDSSFIPPSQKANGDTLNTKENYSSLLIELHQTKEVRQQGELLYVLEQFFEELTLQHDPRTTPEQEKIYALAQKLSVKGKVSELVSKTLIEMCYRSGAATYVPSMAFGAAKWKQYFGDVGVEPPLPPDINAILSAPCPFFPGKTVQQTHLLTLIPKTVNGTPLTLNTLGELVQKPKQGHPSNYDIYRDDIINQYGTTPPRTSYWVLFTKDVIPGSRSKPYNEQKKLVETLSTKAQGSNQASYEVPLLLEAATSLFMHYVQTGTPLYSNKPWTYTRCQERVTAHPEWTLVVGGFAPVSGPSSGGLSVRSDEDDDFEASGVGGSRKFWP